MTDLKPCPFCGGEAELERDDSQHGKYYSIGCSDVDCLAHELIYCVTKDEWPLREAIAAWNRRDG